jgi:omega-amidase
MIAMLKTISVAQMDIRLNDPAANMERAQTWAAEAARRGSHVLLLPELWLTGFDFPAVLEHALDVESAGLQEIRDIARRNQLWLIGSILFRRPDGAVCNRALAVSPAGEIAAAYDKIHLFKKMREDAFLVAGREAVSFEAPWGKSGLAVCFDLRFPELFRRYALAGAVIIFLPSEFPQPRLAHWQVLFRARAIENQLFIIAANRVGQDNAGRYFGHSAIIDPWGEPVLEAGESETLLTADIDLNQVGEVRRRLPSLSERRPEAY